MVEFGCGKFCQPCIFSGDGHVVKVRTKSHRLRAPRSSTNTHTPPPPPGLRSSVHMAVRGGPGSRSRATAYVHMDRNHRVAYCTHWQVNNNNSIYCVLGQHVELHMEPYPRVLWP